MTLEILNTDDPPVAEDFEVIVYSGRPATINLPASDPDGTPVEIYILKEPQGAGQVLKLTDEQAVGTSGRRKVRSERTHCWGELDPLLLHAGLSLQQQGYGLLLTLGFSMCRALTP